MNLFDSAFRLLQQDNKETPKFYTLRLQHVKTKEIVTFENLSEEAMSDIYRMLPCYAWDDLELTEQKTLTRRKR